MTKMDKDSENIFSSWLDFLLPLETSPKELEKLAQKSCLSAAALRKLRNRTRRGMSTDTLIRLALSRGHSVNSLMNAILKVDRKRTLDPSEARWITYGAKLKPRKRVEFLDFIEYLRKNWNL